MELASGRGQEGVEETVSGRCWKSVKIAIGDWKKGNLMEMLSPIVKQKI